MLALAAAVTAAVIFWPGAAPARRQASPRPTQLTGAAGRIVSISPLGSLLVSSAAGTDIRKAPTLSDAGYPLGASPDNRYLSEGNGQVITAPRRGLPAHIKTPIALWPYAIGNPDADSFADHDRYLVGAYQPYFGSQTEQTPVLFSLATGHRIDLAKAHHIAGDPGSIGAFTSTAGPPVASATVITISPDINVVLQRPGRRPQVLATVADLERDLGQKASEPGELVPYPSPSGDAVAITVMPDTGARNPGLVILSRSGRVFGTVPATRGPVAGKPLAWSPSGAALAYVGAGRGGPSLDVWTRNGNRVRSYPFPSSTAGTYRFCLWSPDGQSVLCAADHPGPQWLVATMPGHSMTALHGPGTPVAWLP